MLKVNLGSLVMSLAEMVIGVLLLADPVGFTSGIVGVFGILLMITGVWHVFRYFRTAPEAAATGRILSRGLLELCAGVFCAFRSHWFVAAYSVLTLVYGAGILISGIVKIQWTVDIIRMKRRKWFWMAISGAISFFCGMTVIAAPFRSAAVLWMFVGVTLVVDAVIDMLGTVFGNREPAAEKEGV